MIAHAFLSYAENQPIVIFASGVSNSQEIEPALFDRERELLEKTLLDHPEKTIVYFGTCSVDDPELHNSPYVQHKKAMEELIQKTHQHYFIFRLSQVTGKSKSPTLINYIVRKIENAEVFDVWKKSYRNIIDVEDVFKITDYLIRHQLYKNEITSIAAQKTTSIFEIVNSIEILSGKRACYREKDKGGRYEIDISKIAPYLDQADVNFCDDYINNVIKKYFYPANNVN